MSLALQNLTVSALYFVTGWIGLQLPSYGSSVTLVWPPVGLALAAVILVGPRVAPGIVLGTVLINATTHASAPALFHATIPLGNMLGPVLAGTLLTRRLRFRPQFDRFRDVLAFAAVGVLGCCLITSSLGAAALAVTGMAPFAELPIVWAIWLGGDAAGVLVVAPLVLVWLSASSTLSTRTPSGRPILELSALVTALLATGAVMLTYGEQIPSLAYAMFPFLLWAALRFGPRGATATTLAITTIAVCGTAAGVGPFVDFGAGASPGDPQRMVSLWTFFSVTAVSALLLTALLAERDHAMHQREHAMRELDHRVKNTLATVLAVAEQSNTSASNLSDYIDTFSGRIRSLARSHEALARSQWKGLELDEIVTTVLAPYAASADVRARATGDSIVLSAETTGPLTMALHELATNAAKHGAWSDNSGRVEVSWDTHENGHVHLVWRELDGPPVHPPTTRGFGLRLIEGLVDYELGGESRIDFEPTGLICTLRFREPTPAADSP